MKQTCYENWPFHMIVKKCERKAIPYKALEAYRVVRC
jgi:hypothetical protein